MVSDPVSHVPTKNPDLDSLLLGNTGISSVLTDGDMAVKTWQVGYSS